MSGRYRREGDGGRKFEGISGRTRTSDKGMGGSPRPEMGGDRLWSENKGRSFPESATGYWEEKVVQSTILEKLNLKLIERAFPWVRILTFKRCPRGGNLT